MKRFKTKEEFDKAKADAEARHNDQVASFEAMQAQVDAQIEQMPEAQKTLVNAARNEVQTAIDEVNADFEEGEVIADRFRSAGFKPSEAEALLKQFKPNRIGLIQDHKGKLYVKTVFNTVVEAQTYVDALQDRLIQLTTVPAEKEIAALKTQVATFTSYKFLDLITLAFKRLFKLEKKNG